MGGVLRPIVFSLANFGFNAEQRTLPGARCQVITHLKSQDLVNSPECLRTSANSNHHRVAAEKISKIDRGAPATSVLGFVLAVFRARARARARARSCNCIIPSWSTRCSGGNLVMDWLMEIRSMIRELGNGGLWVVTEIALMPCTRSVRSRARAPSATAD
jgi:hypothetical protein